jgi:glycosyltransferase involved in cell wall biosynthesis
VVGISDYILTKHINNGLFVATQHAVVHNAFMNAQVFRTSSRLEPLRFGYIGRLDPTKGIELLLRTFADLPDADVVLVVAGTGKPMYVEMLKKKYGGARCLFLGYVALEEFYATVDITVVPSLWHEPLGRVVFESYAFGSPVIGSNRGGIPEIIEDGVTGFLFDPDNSTSLIATLRKFVDDRGLVSVMRENCLERATQFLPEQLRDDYLHIYGVVCGEKVVEVQ